MESVPSEPQDCWVLGEDGRRAGVVTAWRRTDQEWTARVVYTVLIDGEWTLVEEWLPDKAIERR